MEREKKKLGRRGDALDQEQKKKKKQKMN